MKTERNTYDPAVPAEFDKEYTYWAHYPTASLDNAYTDAVAYGLGSIGPSIPDYQDEWDSVHVRLVQTGFTRVFSHEFSVWVKKGIRD